MALQPLCWCEMSVEVNLSLKSQDEREHGQPCDLTNKIANRTGLDAETIHYIARCLFGMSLKDYRKHLRKTRKAVDFVVDTAREAKRLRYEQDQKRKAEAIR